MSAEDQSKIIADAEVAFAEWWDGPEPYPSTLIAGFIAGYRTAIQAQEQ